MAHKSWLEIRIAGCNSIIVQVAHIPPAVVVVEEELFEESHEFENLEDLEVATSYTNKCTIRAQRRKHTFNPRKRGRTSREARTAIEKEVVAWTRRKAEAFVFKTMDTDLFSGCLYGPNDRENFDCDPLYHHYINYTEERIEDMLWEAEFEVDRPNPVMDAAFQRAFRRQRQKAS